MKIKVKSNERKTKASLIFRDINILFLLYIFKCKKNQPIQRIHNNLQVVYHQRLDLPFQNYITNYLIVNLSVSRNNFPSA